MSKSLHLNKNNKNISTRISMTPKKIINKISLDFLVLFNQIQKNLKFL